MTVDISHRQETQPTAEAAGEVVSTRRYRRGLPPPPSCNPQPMTAWFHPTRMLRTAFQVVFARAIHTYIDRREVQVTRDDPRGTGPRSDEVEDLSGEKEVWIDYVADLGDGFNSTFAVASLLARRRLQVEGLAEQLPRGRVLVMGGDNVYPTPARNNYVRRTLEPYAAALPPNLEKGDVNPILVAIPGNHDWYDGLTNFLYYFCRNRKVGAWQTLQSRSYFGVRLPGRWSLWGNDIALSNRIDTAQLSYFERLAEAAKLRNRKNTDEGEGGGPQPVERLILCTASPGWLTDAKITADDYENFWFFESECIVRGCVPWVCIAGDIHAYARWSSVDGRQRIVSGGGGSYRRGTSHLHLDVDEPEPGLAFNKRLPAKWKPSRFARSGTSFPDGETSRRLARRALAFPLLRQNWPFCFLLGIFLALFAWSLQPYLGELPGTEPGVVIRPGVTDEPEANARTEDPENEDAGIQSRLALLTERLVLDPLPDGRFVPFPKFWRNVVREMGTTPATWILPAVLVLCWGLFGYYANERRSRRAAAAWGASTAAPISLWVCSSCGCSGGR